MYRRVKFILLDIGNVIFHDTWAESRFAYLLYLKTNQRYKDASAVSYLDDLTRNYEHPLSRCYQEMGKALFGGRWDAIRDECWQRVLHDWGRLQMPMEGALCGIEMLSSKYQLGIIANQPPLTMRNLTRYGIAGKFKFIGLDSEIGYGKPGAEIFHWAMDRIDHPRSEILYVGDKLDNDIVPAGTLGLKTAWIRHRMPDPAENPVRHVRWHLLYSRYVQRYLNRRNRYLLNTGTATPDVIVGSLRTLALRARRDEGQR